MLVTVERSPHHAIGILRVMSVFVDGERIGSIRRGEKVQYEYQGDNAQVWVTMGWCKSKKVTLGRSDESAVTLVCGLEPLLVGLMSSWFTPRKAFSLVRKNELGTAAGVESSLRLSFKALGIFNIAYAATILVFAATRAFYHSQPLYLLPFGTTAVLFVEPLLAVMLICSGLGILKRHRLFGFALSNLAYLLTAVYYAATLFSAFFRAWTPMQKLNAVINFSPAIVFCAFGALNLRSILRRMKRRPIL